MPLTLCCKVALDWLIMGILWRVMFTRFGFWECCVAGPDHSGVTRPMAGSGKFALGNTAKHGVQLKGMFVFRASRQQIGQARVDHILGSRETDLARV